MRRRLLTIALIAAALVAFGAAGLARFAPGRSADGANLARSMSVAVDCSGEQAESFLCHREHFRQLTLDAGVDTAISELRGNYQSRADIRAECHQLTHAIGRASFERNGTLAAAFTQGDPFCSAGYFHGAVEAMLSNLGVDRVLADPDAVCADLGGYPRHSIYHRNCAHGLGHGFMLIHENEVPEALGGCDALKDNWERKSCYGGVFMENLNARRDPAHPTRYLRPEQPLYPCPDLDARYRSMCYQKQTSYPLSLSEADFGQVFALCAAVTAVDRPFCYQGLGTNAAVFAFMHVADDAERGAVTAPICLLGQDHEAQANCVVGAVRSMLNNYFSDAQARAFCAELPADLHDVCRSTARDRFTWPD